MRTLLPLLLVLTACGGAATPPAAQPTQDETYLVLFERPLRPGTRFTESTELHEIQRSVVRAPGQPAEEQTEDTISRLRASVLVLDVDAHGQVLRSELTVKHATRTEGGVEETVFPTGAVLRVTRGTQHDDDGRIEWVGGELTEAQSDWLRGIVTMRMPSSRVDEMVGTRARQPVGGSWPIDASLTARDLNKIRMIRVPVDQVRGRSTLVAVTDVEGTPCLELATEIEVGDVRLGALPPRMHVQAATATVRERRWLPVELARPALRTESALEVRFRAALRAPEGRSEVEVINTSTARTTYSY
ncbi:MAG: hypothetical protein SangKO_013360 [Sandaracinaceae bacterium]